MLEKRKKKKKKKKAPNSVSMDRNGAHKWDNKEDGEISDKSTSPAVTGDEYRLTINELADKDKTRQQTEEQQITQIPAAAADTSPVTTDAAPNKNNTDEAEMTENNTERGWTPTEHELNFSSDSGRSDTPDTQKIRSSETTYLFIANLDASTTEQELIALFGLDATPDTKKWTTVDITYNGRGKYKVYAKLRSYYKFALEILKLDGIIFHRRELIIQPEKNPQSSKQSGQSMGKSNLPYDSGNALLAGSRHRSNPSSRVSNKQGRPSTAASSRQEEPESSSQRKITGV